jgi:DNA-3-methyladenine glycosylase II
MKLSPTPPYDFSKLLALLRRFPCPSSFVVQDGAYYQTLRQRNTLSLIRAAAAEDSIQLERLIGNAPEDAINAQFAQILGTERDLRPFYAYTESQPNLWQIVEPLVGLPVYCTPDVFHALVYVIIEQHISWAAAQRAQRALVEWGGHFIEHDGIRHYALPTPEQLAKATIDDLRPLKITFKRMQLLIDVARNVVDGSLDLSTIRQHSPEDVYNALLSIKGVGHWTASVVIGRIFGAFPYVPHNDVGLQAAVARYFNVEKSAQATQQLFSKYGEYAGLAAHFTLMRWVLEMYPEQSGDEDKA